MKHLCPRLIDKCRTFDPQCAAIPFTPAQFTKRVGSRGFTWNTTAAVWPQATDLASVVPRETSVTPCLLCVEVTSNRSWLPTRLRRSVSRGTFRKRRTHRFCTRGPAWNVRSEHSKCLTPPWALRARSRPTWNYGDPTLLIKRPLIQPVISSRRLPGGGI